MSATKRKRFLFPRWANWLLPLLVVMIMGGGLYAPTIVTFGFSTSTTAVGYQPVQPVKYSHALHAGEMGIDCRYCHSTVERAAFAAIPATQVCMNCHTSVKNDKLPPAESKYPDIARIRESFETGQPIKWTKVHDLPDYAFFNHSAHVNGGIGCVSCHGRIDTMEVVKQDQRLSMSWCIDCHRNPENNLRPKDQITNMHWKPADAVGAYPELVKAAADKFNGGTVKDFCTVAGSARHGVEG